MVKHQGMCLEMKPRQRSVSIVQGGLVMDSSVPIALEWKGARDSVHDPEAPWPLSSPPHIAMWILSELHL